MAKPLDDKHETKVPKRVYVQLAGIADMSDEEIGVYASELADWLRPQLSAQAKAGEERAKKTHE
jgi:hypothetical protein